MHTDESITLDLLFNLMGETMEFKKLPPAWRIEGRANGFAPWVRVMDVRTIEAAAAQCSDVKRLYRFYAVRVRAN